MAFWMNIHGCQLHPKIAIYVGKQLKMIAIVRDCNIICYSVEKLGVLS